MRTVIEDGVTVHDPECVWCEHDCPWNRHIWGAVYCSVCDDHGEAVHAGFGDVPCDCGDHEYDEEGAE